MMDEILDKSFDSEFSKIENLTWYPWIGKDYKDGKRKILVIGESHYLNEDSDEKNEKRKQELTNDVSHTRVCLYEVLVDRSWRNRTYPNLMESLCDRGILPDDKTALSRISFYDFIQRPLLYSNIPSERERPNEEDYKTAWNCFLGVIDILKPTDCIFLGVESRQWFEEIMVKHEIQNTGIEELEKVGRAYPRITSIKRNSINDIPIVFIQHPGAPGFSPTKWHEFLKQQLPEAMNWLNR